MLNILTICTGNTARSIIAESLLRREGGPHVQAFSAGTNPAGLIAAPVRDFLHRRGAPLGGLRSKSVREFTTPGAPVMNVVVTLCHAAAAELPDDLPGNPLRAHWPLDDPLAAPADQVDLALQMVFDRLCYRIGALLSDQRVQHAGTGLSGSLTL